MRYDGIQCLRAIAAILVVFTHLVFFGNFNTTLPKSPIAGAVGVDIFFVISGFVISMSAERLNFKWRIFLINRYCRIIPFYWLMTLPIIYIKLITHTWSWPSAANSLFFIPFFDYGTFHTPILMFGWSLSFEFWFYSLFALLLLFFGRRAISILTPLLILLCLVASLAYHGSWFTPRFLFHPFTLEFSAGVLIYRVRKYAGFTTLIIALPLVLIAAWFTWSTSFLGASELSNLVLGFKRDLIWGSLGVASVTTVISIDNLKLFTWPRFLKTLGDCSYSIYLIQPLALMVAMQTNKHLATPALITTVIYILTAILGGVVVSKLVEIPLTRLVKAQFTTKLTPHNAPSI